MKKIFLIIFVSVLLTPSLIFAAESIVQCTSDPCSFADFIDIIPRITNFIITYLITPLAVLFLTIGGIVLLVSAGNPTLKSLGNKILIATVIGMALAYGSSAIINLILKAIGSKYNVG